MEGIIEGWDRVVENGGITPDEGLCTMIIEAAGAGGVVHLAETALEKLSTINVQPQEYHIAPLMKALCKNNEIILALGLFDRMDTLGIQPNRFTTKPLQTLLQVPENLEIAIKYLRDTAVTKGRNLASTFNTVLAVTLRDRSNQAIALGKEMDDLKVEPTIDTYNILIYGACLRRNTPAIHGYYEDILQRGLEPNKETYERIIVLLITEPVYEDAFLYLSKMEAARLQPSAELLMAFAKKCSLRYDARWKLLVKKMERLNYEVSDELMEYLITNGRMPMRETEFDSTVREED
jgi:pentatricopeptide repeat protein